MQRIALPLALLLALLASPGAQAARGDILAFSTQPDFTAEPEVIHPPPGPWRVRAADAARQMRVARLRDRAQPVTAVAPDAAPSEPGGRLSAAR